jgi:fructose-specific phosphotransferase system IIA component
MVIDEKLICLDLKSSDRLGIIKELGNVAFSTGKVKSLDGFVEAVIERENEFSTAIGYLIAIPHGKSDEVTEPFIVFGRVNNEAVQWDEETGNEVKLVFLIGVPLEQSGDFHLKILANISRNLIDDEFRNKLLTALSADGVYSTLKAVGI